MLSPEDMMATSSSSRHSTIKFVAKVICVTGCIMHLVTMNVNYLKYETDVMYGPYIALSQTIPSETICFGRQSVDETKKMFMEPGPGDSFDSKVENITVAASSVIENCRARNFTPNLVDRIDNCSKLFSASLSVRMNHYRCYTMKPVKDVEFNTLASTASISERDMLYAFSVTKNFTKYNRITFALHFNNWPYEELIYAIAEDIETFPQPKRFSFLQSYEVFEFERLEPPYSTKCLPELPSFCSSNSRMNFSICSSSLCHQRLAVINNYLLSESENGINVQVQPLNTPIKRIEHSPAVQLNHFLIDTFNVVALWCSISVNLLTQSLVSLLERKKIIKTASSLNHWQNMLIEVSGKVHVDFVHLHSKIERYKSQKNNLWSNRVILVARLFILSACTYEMVKISIDFFQYKTKMHINLQLNAKIPIPDVSHCVDVQQWFNVTRPHWRFQNFTKEASQLSREFNYTLADLFHATPHPSSVIKKCRIRKLPESPLTTHHKCREYFKVRKFFHENLLCYLIQPVTHRKLDGEITRERENNPHILYSIVINEQLARVSRQQAIVSYGFPTKSRFLSNRMFKGNKNERVILSFYAYTYEKLTSPYDTNCSMGRNENDCHLECLNYTSINRIPHSELLADPIDKKLVDFNDLNNHSTAQFIAKMEAECSDKCKEVCKDTIVKTVQQNAYSSDEKLELVVNLPRYPLFEFRTVALRSCYDYLYELACCASFWIGFSLIILIDHLRSFNNVHQSPTRFEYLCALTRELGKIVQSKLDSIESRKERKRCSRITRYLKRRFKSFLFICMLTIGFLCQSLNWATMYFEYPTQINTRLEFETGITDMRATLCITLDQLNLTSNYSLRNIWAQSPRPDEIILRCGYRGFYSSYSADQPEILRARLMPRIDSPVVCNSVIKLRKIVTLGMVCYEAAPKLGKYEQAEFNARYHLLGPKNFIFFTLRQVLAKHKLLVTVSTGKADISLLFGSIIPRTGPQQSLRYWIGYFKFVQTLLPLPYQSGVFGGVRQVMCNRECVARGTMNNLTRLSSFGESDYPADVNHESGAQSVSNESLMIRNTCEKNCHQMSDRRAIRKTYYRTYYSGPFVDQMEGENGTISLWFRSTDCLAPHAIFIESFRILDFIIYLGTIYTLWFGLSVLRTIDLLFSPSSFAVLSSSEKDSIFETFSRFNEVSGVVTMTTLQPMMKQGDAN